MKLILFAGKGGVGKTTCAAATAVALADAGWRTLLVSTDPAHSISVSLDQEVGAQLRMVEGVGNLSALELSAEPLLLKFKAQRGGEIKRILETGTHLDEADLDDVLSLSIPGLDEVMALKELVGLMEREEHDFHILDTAPRGHALRLLALPQLLEEWIRALARMHRTHPYVVARLARREIDEPMDDFLFTMKRALGRIPALLRDPDRCEFVIVTIPEATAIAESLRLAEELGRLRIPLRHLLVNRVVSSERAACPFCHERRHGQREALRQCDRAFRQLTTFHVMDGACLLRGIPRLRELRIPMQWFGERGDGARSHRGAPGVIELAVGPASSARTGRPWDSVHRE